MSLVYCQTCWIPFERPSDLPPWEPAQFCGRPECEPYPNIFETRARKRAERAAAQAAPRSTRAAEPAQLPLAPERSRKGRAATRRVEVIRSELL